MWHCTSQKSFANHRRKVAAFILHIGLSKQLFLSDSQHILSGNVARKGTSRSSAKPHPSTPPALLTKAILGINLSNYKKKKTTTTTKGRKCAQPPCELESGKTIGSQQLPYFPFSLPLSLWSWLPSSICFLLTLDLLLIPLTQGCPQVAPSVPDLPGWLCIGN